MHEMLRSRSYVCDFHDIKEPADNGFCCKTDANHFYRYHSQLGKQVVSLDWVAKLTLVRHYFDHRTENMAMIKSFECSKFEIYLLQISTHHLISNCQYHYPVFDRYLQILREKLVKFENRNLLVENNLQRVHDDLMLHASSSSKHNLYSMYNWHT